ncbi:MAG: hypothetical protein Q3998_02645 [Porphyromonas sp.]|nr:hypothetical protein [Porphyromonas sp.]
MNRISNHLKILCLLTPLLFGFSQRGWGQEEEQSWKIKGFVDTYHALRVNTPNNFLSSRTRVRGEIEKTFHSSSLFVSLNASYNALLKDRTGSELREAYLDHREENWGFRIGRQLVIWGSADGVRITDLVSPMDMTEFLAQDYDNIRMPVNALRFFLFNSKMKFEVVLVPTFQGYILPTSPDNPWNIFSKGAGNPIIWDDSKSKPAFKFSNIEYGGRVCFTLPGIDFSLAGLHTWNKIPVLSYKPSPQGIVISPEFYRMGFIGGDFSKPLGQFVLRGETAFNFDKHFSYHPKAEAVPQKGFNTVNWLLGLDWYAPNEWTIMAQLSSESIFKYEKQISQSRHSSLLTFNVSKRLFGSTLQLSNFTYFDLNHKGWFSRFIADYALNDNIRLSAGFDWLGGDEGMFGLYENNSEVWIKAKYSF